MLSSFKVTNYKSIKNEATLDFNANSSNKDMLDVWAVEVGSGEYKTHLLKCILLYGHNASGKSNLCEAFTNFGKSLLAPQNTLDNLYKPYAFDGNKNNTVFEISFYAPKLEKTPIIIRSKLDRPELSELKEYTYKVEIGKKDDKVIIFSEEFNSPEQNMKLLIEEGEVKDISEIFRDRYLKKISLNSKIESSQSLFYLASYSGLEDFEESSVNQLEIFLRHLFFVLQFTTKQGMLLNPEYIDIYREFLKNADLGIASLTLENSDESKNIDPTKKENKKILMSKHNTGHEGWEFKKNESEGTKELMHYASPIFEALRINTIVCVDELCNLHSLATRDILTIFQNQHEFIGYASQLFLVTHDSAILKKDFLRPDQIYFIEKEKHESTVYSLSDFNLTNDEREYNELYLSGRLGAVKDDLESLGYPNNILTKLHEKQQQSTIKIIKTAIRDIREPLEKLNKEGLEVENEEKLKKATDLIRELKELIEDLIKEITSGRLTEDEKIEIKELQEEIKKYLKK